MSGRAIAIMSFRRVECESAGCCGLAFHTCIPFLSMLIDRTRENLPAKERSRYLVRALQILWSTPESGCFMYLLSLPSNLCGKPPHRVDWNCKPKTFKVSRMQSLKASRDIFQNAFRVLQLDLETINSQTLTTR
jgi:hypothetical protein